MFHNGQVIKRSLTDPIFKDLESKIVILSGPRQCGKTTLSKNLFRSFEYLNFDSPDDRAVLSERTWDRKCDLVVFDELHKMNKWKSWVKGVFDKEGVNPRILVTGSARLNQFKKTGDSLAGRQFSYRLHPFDLHELNLKSVAEQEEALDALLVTGGFPEPYLKGSRHSYNRWKSGHQDMILRQDLLDLEPIRDIKSIELLMSLLAERVGSPVSHAGLAKILQKDPKTIARWISILEDLFVIFRVMPFHRSLARAIRKEPKYYFYDVGQVRGERSSKLENLVACSLFKEIQRLHDAEGIIGELCYLRTKDGHEIDFLVQFEDAPAWLIEVKEGDSELSPNFRRFEKHFTNSRRVQLVADLSREKSTDQGHQITRLAPWLARMDLVEVP